MFIAWVINNNLHVIISKIEKRIRHCSNSLTQNPIRSLIALSIN